MTLSNVINEFIEKQLSLPFVINNDLIQDESKDGACLRYDPAPAAEERYNDGTRLVTYNLTYYIRCLNASKARDYARDITNALDGVTLDAEGYNLEIAALTLPQFINKDEKNYTSYAAAIECSYLEKKEIK